MKRQTHYDPWFNGALSCKVRGDWDLLITGLQVLQDQSDWMATHPYRSGAAAIVRRNYYRMKWLLASIPLEAMLRGDD